MSAAEFRAIERALTQRRAQERAKTARTVAPLDRARNRRIQDGQNVRVFEKPVPVKYDDTAPRAPPAPRDSAPLDALFRRILERMSNPATRRLHKEAHKVIKREKLNIKPPTLEEVRAYLAHDPRFQAKFPVNDYPGRAQYGSRPYEILGADLIERDKTTKTVEGNIEEPPENQTTAPVAGNKRLGKLQTMILVIGDRFTRRVWATTLATKTTEDVVAGFRKLLTEIHAEAKSVYNQSVKGRKLDKTSFTPRQMVTDMGLKAGKLTELLLNQGMVHRLKNTSNRQELQNNAVLDAAIKRIQEILQERRVKAGTDGAPDPVWVRHVPPTIEEYNRDSTMGVGMMGSAPDDARTSRVVQFNVQEASAQALAESQKTVEKAEKRLIPGEGLPGTGAFKKVVKDPDELAGRGARRTGDDRWEGKVLRINKIRAGQVKDQDGDWHSMTKVLPVPAATKSTATVRVERSTLSLRRARDDPAVRKFVKEKIVPEFQKITTKTATWRIMQPAIKLNNSFPANMEIFKKAYGTAAKSFAPIRIFKELFPEMFKVTGSKGQPVVKLINPTLPDEGTDPAAPAEEEEVVGRADPEELRQVFGKYAKGLREHIDKQEGKSLTMSKVGWYLNKQPLYTKAFNDRSLSTKKGDPSKILRALGFRLIPQPHPKLPIVKNPA